MVQLLPAQSGLSRPAAAIAVPFPVRPHDPTATRHLHFAPGLVASRAAAHLRPVPALMSMLLHGLMLLGLVEVMRPAPREGGPATGAETMPFYFMSPIPSERAPAPARDRPVSVDRGASDGSTEGVPVARGFQVVRAAIDVPTSIPPVDLDAKPLDPRNYSGIGLEGGIADGVEGGVRVDAIPDLIATEVPAIGMVPVYRVEELQETARVLEQQPPVYPQALKGAGIEGVVRLQFVIDTTGRVEPGSISVLESSQPAFERAARECLLEARFTSAVLGNRKVRQLSQQRFSFRIAPG